MAVFGGLSGAGDVRLNSMWVYRLAQNDWVPLGPACPHSFDCDENDHCNNRGYSIDSCAMPDPDAQQDWRGCSWPAPRSSHTWTRIGNTIYTFAGLRVLAGSLTVVGELWALPIDVEDWSILINMQQYSSSSTYLYPEDTWTFDAPDCAIKWQLLTRPDASASLLSQPAGAPFPSARHQHAATAFDGKLMIMGGSSSAMNRGGSQLQDLWSYDPVADSWTEMLVTPSFLWRNFASPFMRCTPMVLTGPMADANGSAIYIYGGTSLDGDWNNLMVRRPLARTAPAGSSVPIAWPCFPALILHPVAADVRVRVVARGSRIVAQRHRRSDGVGVGDAAVQERFLPSVAHTPPGTARTRGTMRTCNPIRMLINVRLSPCARPSHPFCPFPLCSRVPSRRCCDFPRRQRAALPRRWFGLAGESERLGPSAELRRSHC